MHDVNDGCERSECESCMTMNDDSAVSDSLLRFFL
jgi:hypothetical protein